jgi:hypothetical protein
MLCMYVILCDVCNVLYVMLSLYVCNVMYECNVM